MLDVLIFLDSNFLTQTYLVFSSQLAFLHINFDTYLFQRLIGDFALRLLISRDLFDVFANLDGILDGITPCLKFVIEFLNLSFFLLARAGIEPADESFGTMLMSREKPTCFSPLTSTFPLAVANDCLRLGFSLLSLITLSLCIVEAGSVYAQNAMLTAFTWLSM